MTLKLFPYPNQVIKRLRGKSWYVVLKPEYFYFVAKYNPSMYTKASEVIADIILKGPEAKVVLFNEQKGTIIIHSLELIAADYIKIRNLGSDFDPRLTY